MQVAICGLGRMGAGMARRAARGGHDVVAWNRTEAEAHNLRAATAAGWDEAKSSYEQASLNLQHAWDKSRL